MDTVKFTPPTLPTMVVYLLVVSINPPCTSAKSQPITASFYLGISLETPGCSSSSSIQPLAIAGCPLSAQQAFLLCYCTATPANEQWSVPRTLLVKQNASFATTSDNNQPNINMKKKNKPLSPEEKNLVLQPVNQHIFVVAIRTTIWFPWCCVSPL